MVAVALGTCRDIILALALVVGRPGMADRALLRFPRVSRVHGEGADRER